MNNSNAHTSTYNQEIITSASGLGKAEHDLKDIPVHRFQVITLEEGYILKIYTRNTNDGKIYFTKLFKKYYFPTPEFNPIPATLLLCALVRDITINLQPPKQ